MDWDEDLNLEGISKEQGIPLKLLNLLSQSVFVVWDLFFSHCSHRIKLFNVGINPDSDHNAVPHSK